MKSFKNFNLVCELSMFFYEIVFFPSVKKQWNKWKKLRWKMLNMNLYREDETKLICRISSSTRGKKERNKRIFIHVNINTISKYEK